MSSKVLIISLVLYKFLKLEIFDSSSITSTSLISLAICVGEYEIKYLHSTLSFNTSNIELVCYLVFYFFFFKGPPSPELHDWGSLLGLHRKTEKQDIISTSERPFYTKN